MTFPDRLDLTITIGGNDVTVYLVPGTFEVNSVLTHQVDTAQFELREASAVEPDDWDEVIIADGSDRIFAGYVMNKKARVAGVGINYTIEASDYSVLLDKVYVRAEYEDDTDAEIISDLFTEYLSEINTSTYVTALTTHDRIRFNRKSLREVLDTLADLAQGDWYIDYNKNLHWFASEGNAAPFSLSDSPDLSTSYPYYDLQVETNGVEVANRVEVVGGSYLSDDTTFYLPGTGQDVRVTLPFRLHAPDGYSALRVWRNDGTESSPSWTALTALAGYIDTLSSTSEVLHYYQDQILEQQNAWPELPNAVKVTGRYSVPLRTRMLDANSQAHYGRTFEHVLTDEDIVDQATAKLAAKAVLAKSSMSNTALTFVCRQPGLQAGQSVTIVSSLHGINDSYLVQSVSARIGVYGLTEYTVTAGTYNPDLIDMIVKIARDAKKRPIWREDEVLDDYQNAFEELDLTESDTDLTTTSGPYVWSPASGGNTVAKWNFSKWG